MPSHEARISRAVADLKTDLSPAQLDRVVAFVRLLASSTSIPFTTVQTSHVAETNTRERKFA
jgi:hypothetical protein